MKSWFLIALAIGASPAAAEERLSRAEREAVAATPEQIADRADIQNDPLDTVIRVSTQPVYQQRQGLLRVTNGDKFMRAFIDKNTLEVRYQLYLWTSYQAQQAARMNRLNYESQDGPGQAELHLIDTQVIGCGRYGCTYQEHIAADIPVETLRWVASQAQPGVDQSWQVRVFAQSGEAINTGILRTEVAGILLAVERQLASLPAVSRNSR